MSTQVKISLNNQKLKSFGEQILVGVVPDLVEEVDASNNQIQQLENRPLGKFKFLTWLDLSRNQIKELNEACFSQFIHLTYLDLSFNQIEELDESVFGKYTRLTDFYISNNQLKRLSKDLFFYCKNLEWIDVSHNLLNYLPDNIFNACSKLIYLNYSNNLVRENDFLNSNLSAHCKQLRIKLDFIKVDYTQSTLYDFKSFNSRLDALHSENDSSIYLSEILDNKIHELIDAVSFMDKN